MAEALSGKLFTPYLRCVTGLIGSSAFCTSNNINNNTFLLDLGATTYIISNKDLFINKSLTPIITFIS